jgi:UDP-glucose 4-epimerase
VRFTLNPTKDQIVPREKILVTGGAGFIGSHTCVELLANGFDVHVIDNFSNAKPDVIKRVEIIANQPLTCFNLDLRDKPGLKKILGEHTYSAIIHFAGLKAVGESVQMPLHYYQHNLEILMNLLECKAGQTGFIFSSSATVYDTKKDAPYNEADLLSPINPYGQTKLMAETILKDVFSIAKAKLIILRYFNPIGAHPSGLIGEDPQVHPNNLMPYILEVASKARDKLYIFGDDYETPDGTGCRDYIHVVDLAQAHVKAVSLMQQLPAFNVFNIGTGKSTSVLELVAMFERENKVDIPYEITDRRQGDASNVFADVKLANQELGWHAKFTIADMCRDAYRFIQNRR